MPTESLAAWGDDLESFWGLRQYQPNLMTRLATTEDEPVFEDDPFYNADLNGFDVLAYVAACVVPSKGGKGGGARGRADDDDGSSGVQALPSTSALGDELELPAIQKEHQYIVARWALDATGEVKRSAPLQSQLVPIFGKERLDFTPRNCEEMRVFLEAVACTKGSSQGPLAERSEGVDPRLAEILRGEFVKDDLRVERTIMFHQPKKRVKRPGCGGSQGDAGGDRLAPLVDVSIDFNPHSVLVALQTIDQNCGWNRARASRTDVDSGYDAVFTEPEDFPNIPAEVRKDVMAAYELMITMLHHPRIKQRYGYTSQDHRAAPLKEGASVPSYFANVGGESIFRRKLLSVGGLRNLVIYGPAIYTQLRDKMFSSNPQEYQDGSGITIMRNVTGNVVDLDWTVLRCSDRLTMETINMSNAHKNKLGKQAHSKDEDGLPFPLPLYGSTQEFGDSIQAKQIAHHSAVNLLTQFAKQIHVDGAEKASIRNKRHIDLSQLAPASSIPVACDNSSRGHHPMWRYQNCGQDSYHVNVPNMEQVNGALLRAPFHCVQYWVHIIAVFFPPTLLKRGYRSDWGTKVLISDQEEPTDEQRALLRYQELLTDSERNALGEFELRVDAFFEQCIVDSCFNMKWKAIEEFGESLEHEGTIVDVLQRTQMANQHIFTADFFDADDEELRTNEIDVMWELVQGMVGKCKADGGARRAITMEDVKAWVLDPSISI